MDNKPIPLITKLTICMVFSEAFFVNNTIRIVYLSIITMIYFSPRILLKYHEVLHLYLFASFLGIFLSWINK